MGSRSRSRDRRRRRSRSVSPRSRKKRAEDSSRPVKTEKGSRRRDDHRHRDDVKIKREKDDNRSSGKKWTSGANATDLRVKKEPEGGKRFGDGQPFSTSNDDNKAAEKPSFELSGKLMEDTNVFNGVVIKYSEPEEARKPKKRWRFYVFKGQEQLPVMHIHRQSAYLIGKDRKIADIPIDHPSCSRQHAVLQYRAVNNHVVPYIIDLNSSNGTFLNNNKIDPQRYVEVREKDVLKFGFSSREYVLLHENSDQ